MCFLKSYHDPESPQRWHIHAPPLCIRYSFHWLLSLCRLPRCWHPAGHSRTTTCSFARLCSTPRSSRYASSSSCSTGLWCFDTNALPVDARCGGAGGRRPVGAAAGARRTTPAPTRRARRATRICVPSTGRGRGYCTLSGCARDFGVPPRPCPVLSRPPRFNAIRRHAPRLKGWLHLLTRPRREGQLAVHRLPARVIRGPRSRADARSRRHAGRAAVRHSVRAGARSRRYAGRAAVRHSVRIRIHALSTSCCCDASPRLLTSAQPPERRCQRRGRS